MSTVSLSSPLGRIGILDALRGFALLGVILIHMIQHFGMAAPPSDDGIMHHEALDGAVRWFSYNIIMGKFINIFAFLFGMSFFIQMDRAKKKGIDFTGRFVWRMILLFMMGIIAHSFFNIEIISVYAVFGLLMLLLDKFNNTTLMVLAVILLIGVPRIIQVISHNQELQTTISKLDEESSADTAEPEHLANPSFINTAKYNYKERLPGKLNYQFGYIGRGFVTLALFILGLIVGRIRFFENLYINHAKNKKLFYYFLAGLLIVSCVQYILPPQNTRIFFRAEGEYLSSSVVLAQTLKDISLVLFTGVLVMGFILLYRNEAYRNRLDVLAPYGRTALTNYLMQGVIGAFLFAPWAFGTYFGRWGLTSLFILGIIFYILQIIFSKYWLKNYLYGPLEWLWRSGTYMKLQPFKKRQP